MDDNETPPGDAGPTVVVAVDGSATSAQAMRRALAEAQAHGGVLTVLYAWDLLDQPPGQKFDPGFNEAKAAEWLEGFIDEVLGAERPAWIVAEVVNDLATRAIIEASDGALMVVVGSRGLGGFRGLLLGSVSHQVVNHARCPVLIVPGGERG